MQDLLNVERFASFSDGTEGGNPAGVVIGEALPDEMAMRAIAKAVNYSETAFAAPLGSGWRVRYFSPESEVPFCGHATIALGAALAKRHGERSFDLQLNGARISVEGRAGEAGMFAALQSPLTASEPVSNGLLADALQLFSLTPADLDPALGPGLASAGNNHIILALKSRQRLSDMAYDLDIGRSLMLAHELTTISLLSVERPDLFHARNAFASGGVFEDPATGSAAAALGGYLRDVAWPHGGAIDIVQGEDMGMRSLIRVEIPPAKGASIRVSGNVRLIGA